LRIAQPLLWKAHAHDFFPGFKIGPRGSGQAVKRSVQGRALIDTKLAERARGRIARAGLSHRCEVVAGDAFAAVPTGGDACLLSRVIHDWDDGCAIAILDACRRAIGNDGRVLLVERLLPERAVVSHAAQSSSLSDLNMMVMNGGRERTETEYRELLDRAGLALARIVPIESGASVLEAQRAK
jgi:hypothetical protein